MSTKSQVHPQSGAPLNYSSSSVMALPATFEVLPFRNPELALTGWGVDSASTTFDPSANQVSVTALVVGKAPAHKLTEIGLEYTLLEAPATSSFHSSSEPGYCLLSSYGVGEKTLYFHGHYDVVPSSDPAQFRPFIKGDKLFGRGSSDMKGGLVAMIAAIQAIKECGIRLRGKIGLTIVADEETGGQRGTQYLVDHGLLVTKQAGTLKVSKSQST